MPEYLSPRVYVEELEVLDFDDFGLRMQRTPRRECASSGFYSGWAEAASPTVTFIGFAGSGPLHTPTLVTNWSQYIQTFGEVDQFGRLNLHIKGAYLSHAVRGFFLNGGNRGYVIRVPPQWFSSGTSASLQLPPGATASSPATALHRAGEASNSLAQTADEVNLEALLDNDLSSIVCCPDLMAAYERQDIDPERVRMFQLRLINECERFGDRMVILDPPPGLSPIQVRDWRIRTTNYDSKFAALYYPWLTVSGHDHRPTAVPPCGHVAGVWARNDVERGVHRAPANLILHGALGASTEVTLGEHDILNPFGINVLRHSPGRGVRVWGARTLSSEPAHVFVHSRRLVNYIISCIRLGTEWVIYEQIADPAIWARIENDISAFLTLLWRAGALDGETPEAAFYVRCDEEQNRPETLGMQQLRAEVGLMRPSGWPVCLRLVWLSR